ADERRGDVLLGHIVAADERIADLLHLVIGELVRLDLHGCVAGGSQTRLGPGDGIVDDVLALGRRGVGDVVDLELRTALERDAEVEAGEEGDEQGQDDEGSCDRQPQLRLADEGDRGLTVVEPVAPGKEPFHLSASLPSSSASSSPARRAAFRSAIEPPLSRDRAAVVFDGPVCDASSDEESSASVSVRSPVSVALPEASSAPLPDASSVPSAESSVPSAESSVPSAGSSVSVSVDSSLEAPSLCLRLRSAMEPPACLRFFFPLDVAADSVVSAAVVDSVTDPDAESSDDSPALR